jgi:glycosyltransferase involved in cell wall biosynthesis
MTHGPQTPVISVATVAGSQRQRVRRLLADLAAQTIADRIEVLVVDCRPELGGLDPPPGLRLRVLGGKSLSFGQARAEAARSARAEIVAYLEDHCYPEPGWAEALAAAYRESWASVGYAVDSANPRRLGSRINHLAHYGQWLSPRRGRTATLAGNNVSYRRAALLGLDSDLGAMLGADYNVHASFRRRGLVLASEPAARVRHENEETVLSACRSGFVYSRQLAHERARLERWGRTQRFGRAAGILVGGPLARLAGLVQASVRHPGRLGRVVIYLPAILAAYMSSAMGESIGYLLGSGSATERLMYWEVDAPRADGP